MTLDELQAETIAVPPFEKRFLESGLAVHFRCHHPEAEKIRVDVMSKMRGVDDFATLWARRTTVGEIGLLSLPDLVKAKKTQRDKDWPMVSRLVEANYFTERLQPTPQQIEFWLRELRNPLLLLEVCQRFPLEREQNATIQAAAQAIQPRGASDRTTRRRTAGTRERQAILAAATQTVGATSTSARNVTANPCFTSA